MKVFCSGIGGVGLSAYASHMKARGHDVSGSDKSPSLLTQEREASGISVSYNQDGSAVPEDTDLFVYSEAIPETSLERQIATERNIPQQSYFKALGELTKNSHLICIAGTHGKSSTTAMLAGVLIDAGRDPNVVIGTKSPKLEGRNWRRGKSDLWIVEACEYKKSFHYLSPSMILLTNADGDHYDAFSDHDDYRNAFVTFVQRLPSNGTLVYHARDNDSSFIAEKAGKNAVDADGSTIPALGVPGAHMRENAELVAKASDLLQISSDVMQKSLAGFAGTWRRMEKKRVTPTGTTIIDDYAHHPKEILATLSAMREAYPTKRLVCVFQPHTHDRTLKLWDDFVGAFSVADVVVLTDVYDARPDRESATVDMKKFAADVEKSSGTTVFLTTSLSEAKQRLENEILEKCDIVITMGAGDVTSLSESLVIT